MDNKKLLIGGAIALVVIGLIIGVVIYIRKMASNQLANTANASSTANSVPNPGNSYAPGQNTPAGRIPVRQFPTKDELIALAVKKNWDAPYIHDHYFSKWREFLSIKKYYKLHGYIKKS